jgi:CheY-like chemotaxis protein
LARILIADDDPRVRNFLRGTLEANHHEVLDAGDGLLALVIADQLRPDLFLCDLFMDETDSLQMMREFRRAFPSVPMVAMSADVCGHQMDMLPVAKHLGAARMLSKPFGQDAVLAVVSELLQEPLRQGSP